MFLLQRTVLMHFVGSIHHTLVICIFAYFLRSLWLYNTISNLFQLPSLDLNLTSAALGNLSSSRTRSSLVPATAHVFVILYITNSIHPFSSHPVLHSYTQFWISYFSPNHGVHQQASAIIKDSRLQVRCQCPYNQQHLTHEGYSLLSFHDAVLQRARYT